MMGLQKTLVAMLVGLVALGIAAIAFLALNGPSTAPQSSASLAIGGPFTLLSMNGDTITDRTYRGKWLLVYFGYTHCPDECPTALNNIGIALQTLGPQAAKLQALFITVDPKRDTPAVLRDYLKSFDPRIIGLTGSQAQIDAVAKAYRIAHEVENTGDDNYGVGHSIVLYLMNPNGGFIDVFGADQPTDRLAAWIREKIN